MTRQKHKLTEEEILKLAAKVKKWKKSENPPFRSDGSFEGLCYGAAMQISRGEEYYSLTAFINEIELGRIRGRYTFYFDREYSEYVDCPRDRTAERLIELFEDADTSTCYGAKDDYKRMIEARVYLHQFLRPLLRSKKRSVKK
jgi:hypothetical protein